MARFPLTLALFAATLVTSPGVEAAAFEGTFLQLLEHHRDWSEARWGRLLDEMAPLGVREVVVQWTVHDGASFVPSGDDSGAPNTLERLLAAADRREVRVTLGLVSDVGFWEWIDRDREARLVEVSLRRLEERHGEAAVELARTAGGHPSFAGWYLPEEIDDRSWLPDDRREVLARHLGRMRDRLRALTPGMPVAVSGFSNGFADPETLAELWVEIAEGSGIDRVLLQDGVGAGKLQVGEVPIVLGPVAKAFAQRPARFQVIVELFRQTGGAPLDEGPFRAAPADAERIRTQAAIARELSEGGILAFAVPEYLSSEAGPEAAALAKELTAGE